MLGICTGSQPKPLALLSGDGHKNEDERFGLRVLNCTAVEREVVDGLGQGKASQVSVIVISTIYSTADPVQDHGATCNHWSCNQR